MNTVVIPRRFNGPPSTGNGGYSCGVIAAALRLGDGDGGVITLRSPPPLDAPMAVREADGGIVVEHEGRLIAEAARSDFSLDLAPAVPFDDAAARSRAPKEHPFPTCFVCGPEHPTGLHIYPARVPGRDVFAAPWVPREDTTGQLFVWAAIDCPGAWTGGGPGGMLGRLEGRVFAVPATGDRCVAVSWRIESGERKWISGTALYGPRGDVLACSRTTWIVPRG